MGDDAVHRVCLVGRTGCHGCRGKCTSLGAASLDATSLGATSLGTTSVGTTSVGATRNRRFAVHGRVRYPGALCGDAAGDPGAPLWAGLAAADPGLHRSP